MAILPLPAAVDLRCLASAAQHVGCQEDPCRKDCWSNVFTHSYCCVESPCFLWGRSLTEPQVAKAKQHWAHSGVACRYLCQAEPSCRVWVFHIPASDDLELAGPCLLSEEELPEISAESEEAAVAGGRFCAPAALSWAAEVRRETLETKASEAAADAAAQLRREGWAVLRGALPPLQRQLLRRAAEAASASLLAKDPQHLGNRGPRRYSWGGASSSHHMVHHAAWAQLLSQPWLLPVLQEAFGAEFMAVGGGGDFVLGDTDSHQRLHVDLQLEEMYVQDSPAAIVANFVVSEIGCRDGPLRLVPYTQRMPMAGLAKDWGYATHLQKEDFLVAQQNLSFVHLCPLSPGDVILRDMRLWHGGSPNLGREPRFLPSAEFLSMWYADAARRARTDHFTPRPVLPLALWLRMPPAARQICRRILAAPAAVNASLREEVVLMLPYVAEERP
ncbi:unnamed protein product [Effrenium voratum]|nr:unnamed protein product [Effrenium voratum]